MKTCITCHREKPMTEFYRRAASSDGHAPLCKECHREYQQRWTSENRERVREKHRVRSRRYVLRNPDERRESARAYRSSHADQRDTYNREYNERKPLVRVMIKHRYLSRQSGTRYEKIPTEQLEAKIAEYGGLCAHCQERPYEEWDHVVPRSKGGPTSLSNLVPSCVHCNHTKCANLWPAPIPPVMVASPS